MISKNQIKYIKSLQKKGARVEGRCFLVEGIKMIKELLPSDFKIQSLWATEKGAETFQRNTDFLITPEIISTKEMERISSLKNPPGILDVVEIPNNTNSDIENGHVIVLDGVNDPGNLGGIIRTADWFGINQIVCSENSVDCYNPKVIQATMGGIFRVDVVYTNLSDYLSNIEKPIIGLTLNGEELTTKITDPSILVFGSESHGVSKEIQQFFTKERWIPKKGKAESLNLGVAVGIVCNQLA